MERREVDVVCSFLDFQSANVLSRRVGFVHLVPFVSKSFRASSYGMPPEKGRIGANIPIVDHVAYRDMVAGFADWMKLTANSQMKYVSNNSTTYYHLVRSGLGIGFLGNYAALDPELLPDARPPRTHHDPPLCRWPCGYYTTTRPSGPWLIGSTRLSTGRVTRGSVRDLIQPDSTGSSEECRNPRETGKFARSGR